MSVDEFVDNLDNEEVNLILEAIYKNDADATIEHLISLGADEVMLEHIKE
jgi:hypothetical protein